MERDTKLRLAKSAIVLAAAPFLIYAYEYGPDAGVAGVPGENGTCSQVGCHTGTGVNAGGGSVSVAFPNDLTYTPGVTQHLVVTIEDAKQRRWGFELTARLAADPRQMAGTFSPTNNRTQLICSSADFVRQANFSTACPTNLPLSYIEHTQAGYDFLQADPGKYEFDWNPPSTDTGPVVIYVAGNAANGDLTQNGDHIYTANYTLAAATAVPPAPAPAISGVLNAASQGLGGLPNSAIAQGSIFLINGNSLGPDPGAQSAVPLQTSLAGASVQVTVNGAPVAAPIVAASAKQITAVMPSATPSGSGTVAVTVNGQTSAPAQIQVAAAAFGIYTLNGAGSGPAQIADGNGNAVTLTNPAQPGANVTLTGTGLGAIGGTDDVSQPSKQDISSAVTLYVGPEQASVQYAGRSGSAPGQDQITFAVPQDAITGCYVPVSVVVQNVTSNFASLAIAPAGSACSDDNGFTASQVQQIQAAGGNTRMATLNLVRSVSTSAGTVDSGSAVFGMYTPGQLTSSLGPSQMPSAGGCMVFTFSGSSPTITDPTQPQGLNAGAAITVSGPNGAKLLTARQGSTAGVYSAQLAASANGGALFLDPGSYTFSGPGGADVGSLEGQFTVPAPIVWSNAATTTSVARAQGVTVTWTGGDPNGFVNISGYSLASQTSTGAIFTCTAAAGAGTFTVPPMVTLALPASSSGGLSLMGVSAPAPFTAQGIDIGLVTASSGVSQPALFQ